MSLILSTKKKFNIVISIVGPSNSGKSTFLNTVLGEKISIVSHKIQTTRSGLRGIYNNNNVQMIFIDTPGLFDAKTNFEKAMVENAFSNLNNFSWVISLSINIHKSLSKVLVLDGGPNIFLISFLFDS